MTSLEILAPLIFSTPLVLLIVSLIANLSIYVHLKGNRLNPRLGLFISFNAFLWLVLFCIGSFFSNLLHTSIIDFKLYILFFIASAIFYSLLYFIKKILFFKQNVTLSYRQLIFILYSLIPIERTVFIIQELPPFNNYIFLGIAGALLLVVCLMGGTAVNMLIFLAAQLPNHAKNSLEEPAVDKVIYLLFNHVKTHSARYIILFEFSSFYRYFNSSSGLMEPAKILGLSFLFAVMLILVDFIPKKNVSPSSLPEKDLK